MRKIKNKKVRTALFIALAVVILAAAGGGYYVLRVKYISDIGIKLTPSRDYPASNVTYYLQERILLGQAKKSAEAMTAWAARVPRRMRSQRNNGPRDTDDTL